MQVHPIKPKLKAPGTTLLTLKCDEPLSTFAFKINLRHYTSVECFEWMDDKTHDGERMRCREVGRCRLTLSSLS